MRQLVSFLLAVMLHAGVISSALVYFPAAASKIDDVPFVSVELVSLAENTNVRAAREEPEPEPEPEPLELEPEPEPEPVPIQSEPEPELAPEPVLEPVIPEPEPEPEIEVPVEPEPEEPVLDLNDLSQLVDRSRERTQPDEFDVDSDRQRAGAGTAMTATLQAMIASQIQICLRSNADAPSTMDLRVSVQMRLERDGSLATDPQLVDQRRILTSTNPYLRIAGERALRAASECAPYDLPARNYQEWRRLDVNIDTQLNRR